ncbi:MAG: MFS transporter [Saccharolobus sp.]|uniref:MFS transporter n=1 Tax=Saccharolobus TaxID=2100760 RepID=UPI001F0DABCF|nr:MFS transporter [Saccharolobus shibatae]MCH4815847.1 MFS transporter [Saccharolobus shibatae]
MSSGRTKYLVIGLIAMLFNSTYQYSWNAYEPLIMKDLNANIVQVELAFTLFVILSTMTQILSGYLADLYGPRLVGIPASLLMSCSLILSSIVSNINLFYITWSLGSIGVGILFGLSLNLAIKWFEDKRGLASGLVSMGFGIGGAIANPFILHFTTYREPMLLIGILALVTVPILYVFAKYPKNVKGRDPVAIIKERNFWLVYLSFSLIAVPLLLSSSSLSVIGRFMSLTKYSTLIVLFPTANGIGRPIIGFISDKIGRTKGIILINVLMILAVILLIISIFQSLITLLFIGIILIGMMGGASLPIYMSFIGDLYGAKFSTSNTAILYTGKAISGVLGSTTFIILYVNYGYFSLYFILLLTFVSLISIMIIRISHK